ncbi:Transcriptional regulator, TetR family [[Actinomadura] parvosata subsp. kistnae]|uniref:TetR family transcriptional regulator n=1 Tax=[Actinomadura] parvosata subsp. kistnae TaxID=1909395 RepID=A0A1U9ZZU7_9ACTN|nr:TetR family transcriptional regulator [Nonomuraea sp. ATCC 55076]AQZ63457.1 TetR family transcriptional regulator [Nonomuraea sp. ATCC 55076]SPL99190.1 Transcriptional regulator, TetR family [Actinomadura parvosata subsp. kistnae]
MPRSGAEARRRLQQAALELYRERGFDRTTTAEIAARAGLTERTFFRHFPDKREVLFDGEADLRAALTQAIAAAPDGLQPLDLLLHAFREVEHLLEDNRPFAEPRLRVIAATPALRERDLAKAASIAEAAAQALRRRGVPARPAGLAAHVGWATFHQAAQAWIDDSSQSLDAHLLQAFADLRALCLTALTGDPGR